MEQERAGRPQQMIDSWQGRPHTSTESDTSREPVSPRKAANITAVVLGLCAQFPGAEITEGQAHAFCQAFVEDLGFLDVRDIEEAAKTFRRNPKNRFRPTSGQLLELGTEARIEREAAERRRATPQIATTVRMAQSSRPILWWALPRNLWRDNWTESDVPAGDTVTAKASSWCASDKVGAGPRE